VPQHQNTLFVSNQDNGFEVKSDNFKPAKLLKTKFTRLF